MQIGIDSFASAMYGSNALSSADAMEQLLDRIVRADEAGLDVFGIGEHHKKEFLDSAPAVILSAAAARTKRIRLMSAVKVLSTDDPVRVYQSFATLDLISKGRAELVVGRGSAIEAFPLFRFDLKDYDALFAEKLDLLLQVRDQEFVTWSGKFRPAIKNQPVYPRALQQQLPVWLGVGGTPASFVRAGALGLPLMVAVIGGQTASFRPLVDLYREAGRRAGPIVVSTANVASGLNKPVIPQLEKTLNRIPVFDRTGLNAWEDKEFVEAVKATGRKKLIMTALWTEVCLAFPALDALREGYEVYMVVDAVGGTSKEAHDAAIRRMENAGAISISTAQLFCELQRDWSRTETVAGFVKLFRETGGNAGIQFSFDTAGK